MFERILTELRSEKFEWFGLSPIEPFNQGADTGIANGDGYPAIEGISGSKVGLNAWDNPVTMMKTVQDNMESLEQVFRALETCAKGDVKKEELVRIIMTKTKKLCAWKDGNFQTRFMRIAAKL